MLGSGEQHQDGAPCRAAAQAALEGPPSSSLLSLPGELQGRILLQLPQRDRRQAALVCRGLRDLERASESLWRRLVLRFDDCEHRSPGWAVTPWRAHDAAHGMPVMNKSEKEMLPPMQGLPSPLPPPCGACRPHEQPQRARVPQPHHRLAAPAAEAHRVPGAAQHPRRSGLSVS